MATALPGELSLPDYVAIAARGIEGVAAAELRELGAAEVAERPGSVHFSGDNACLYRALAGCRTVTRILWPLREFAATTPQMVYSQTRRVRWEEFLNPAMTFAVQATISGQDSPARAAGPRAAGGSAGPTAAPRRAAAPGWLRNSMFAAQKIKDAIVDRLRQEQGARPNVDRRQPQVLVHAHFAGGRCTLSLDAAGRSLHERGYRQDGGTAPLKETLAAAIVALTGWNGQVPLVDPMCGSGTLVIEAAMRALRMAPGLSRTDYLCHRWPGFDRAAWERVMGELAGQRLGRLACGLYASDIDAAAVRLARAAAHRAGVGAAVQLSVQELASCRPPVDQPGVILTNPPYGERSGQKSELGALYRQLGELLRDRFAGWTAWLFCGDLALARNLPLVASARYKLWNGPIPCRLLKFEL